jgi:hypothetical protein
MRRLSFGTRQLTEVIVFAALYAVLTWIFAPVSFLVLQFRVSEALKSIVVTRKHLILAFAVGNAIGNLASPFVGPWELIWMPLVNLVGGYAAWRVGRTVSASRAYGLGGLTYALIVALGVTTMLITMFGLNPLATYLYLAVPELTLIVGFSPAMRRIDARLGTLTNAKIFVT